MKAKNYIADLFFTKRFYGLMVLFVACFTFASFFPVVQPIIDVFFIAFIAFTLLDYAFLFLPKKEISGRRLAPNMLSNGDENTISIVIKNLFRFAASVEIIDELPEQLQIRNWKRNVFLKSGRQTEIVYSVKPLQRGDYQFGDLLFFVSSPVKLVCRRITVNASTTIPVYPSFIHLHKYHLLSNQGLLVESGNQPVRRVGQSMEFEQIKEYVSGDDLRTLNWKATARRGNLMVNNYIEEKSQHIYCIIDKGRLMKMPFNGMTLLDYAINSCLVLSNICLKKQDKVGLITFSSETGDLLAADKRPMQLQNILQLLYKQKTDFLESDFELLYSNIRSKIKHRSLLILFTNFESLSGLNRQIDYLRSLARNHLLVVIFFENTVLETLRNIPARNVEQVYMKTIAEKFAFEKRTIARELSKYGILSILSSPANLTVKTINKYLELKARQAV